MNKRIIPSLLLKDEGLVKGVKYKDFRYLGDPINAIKIFNVKVFGMVNTCHEKIYKYERGLDFCGEFYADLDYDEKGTLIIAKGSKNKSYDSNLAVQRCLRAISEKKVKNTSGDDTDVGNETICIHSDTPNAVEILKKLNEALKN